MTSLTPLHETYCKWDRTPPTQADVLEGLAQLVTMRFNDVAQELIKTIQREILYSFFGLSERHSEKIHSEYLLQHRILGTIPNGVDAFRVVHHSYPVLPRPWRKLPDP